jgi:hypothetical protein
MMAKVDRLACSVEIEVRKEREPLMDVTLPNGAYPFIDQRFPLESMAMAEAPLELERLIREQAEVNGIELVRGAPVELTCRSEQYPDATFLVYWPFEENRLHILMPKNLIKGKS